MSIYHMIITFFFKISIPVALCSNWSNTGSSLPLPPPLQNEFPTKCFQDLGCFETGPPYYHPIFRPISLLPFDAEKIPTKFLLFTRRNPAEPEYLDPRSVQTIRTSSFNPYCPTKVIIHGFSVNRTANNEYITMKNAILRKGRYNVILVDWTESNQSPYFQAVANGRVVGAQVARLIHALQRFTGAVPERFHIIGHSLGAAVAGWAGERIQNLGRITGLDPAGMYFYNAPPAMRLDTSDAKFVDVIITNGGTTFEEGIGTIEPIGHMNFYPNGGSVQPGCFNSSQNAKEFDFIRNLCSHLRSVQLFISSILYDHCKFIGTPCEDYTSFLSGKCDDRYWWRSIFDVGPYSKKAVMGFDAELKHVYRNYNYSPVKLQYYLRTNAAPPFCIGDQNQHIYSVNY